MERNNAPRSGPKAPVPPAARRQERRRALLRRHQAAELASAAQRTVRSEARPGRGVLALLVFFFGAGLLTTVDVVLALPPDGGIHVIAFLVSSGLAVWGAIGLAVAAIRRNAPARQADLVAYDALRQGLLVAGCLELNLATRLLDLWTPVIGGLLLAVFAVFEVVTLARRPT